MIKGDKIRLVKPMGAFTNVGEVCEVINITEEGVISFRFGSVHLGCMSYDEYEKYFERVEVPFKKAWSDWESKQLGFYDLNDTVKHITVRFRDNGKKVQVRSGAYKSESTCNKEDVFDFDKGFELAVKRLIVKYLDGQVKAMAKTMQMELDESLILREKDDKIGK